MLWWLFYTILLKFTCETSKLSKSHSNPGNFQNLAIGIKLLAQGSSCRLWWGSNLRLANLESRRSTTCACYVLHAIAKENTITLFTWIWNFDRELNGIGGEPYTAAN